MLFQDTHSQHLLGSYSGLPSRYLFQHLGYSGIPPVGNPFSVDTTNPFLFCTHYFFLKFQDLLRENHLRAVFCERLTSQRSEAANTRNITSYNTENQARLKSDVFLPEESLQSFVADSPETQRHPQIHVTGSCRYSPNTLQVPLKTLLRSYETLPGKGEKLQKCTRGDNISIFFWPSWKSLQIPSLTPRGAS